MHYLLFVTTDKENAETSQDARSHVYNWLYEQDYVGEGTRFNSCYADWLVIGGRWSGHITQELLNKEQLKQDISCNNHCSYLANVIFIKC